MAGNLFVRMLLGKTNHDEDLGCIFEDFTHSLASEAQPPGNDPMNPHNVFAELKRRNVYKVAVAYAVVSWLLMQAASILFPTFEMPAVAMKILVVILAAGFVVALVIAWGFEMTPEGMKRTEDVAA